MQHLSSEPVATRGDLALTGDFSKIALRLPNWTAVAPPFARLTYFNWKKKYDGLLQTEMRRLKQLEEENSKVVSLVAPGRHHN